MARANPRWSVRPPHPGELDAQPIDWQHPITRGLVALPFPALGYDIASKALVTRHGTGGIRPTPAFGPAWRMTGLAAKDYAYVPVGVRSFDAKTVAFWCAGDGNSGIDLHGCIGSVLADASPNRGYILALRSPGLTYSHWGVSGGVTHNITTNVGEPRFCAVTTGTGGNDIRLYVDGIEGASGSLGLNSESHFATYMGAYSFIDRFASGWHGPSFVFNRVLSPAEIWSLYAPQTRWQMLRARSTRRWFTPGSTPPATSGFRLINGRQHRPGSLVA